MTPMEGTLKVDPGIIALHTSAPKAKKVVTELIERSNQMEAEAERKRKRDSGEQEDGESSAGATEIVESEEEATPAQNKFASAAASSGVPRAGDDEILDTPKDKVMQPASGTVDTIDSDGAISGDDDNVPTDIVRPYIESLASGTALPRKQIVNLVLMNADPSTPKPNREDQIQTWATMPVWNKGHKKIEGSPLSDNELV